MIEAYLIAAGLGCGTVPNFQTSILNDMRVGNPLHWYFRTPIGYKGDGWKSSVVDLAFPFLALKDEDPRDEKPVYNRLSAVMKSYVDDLTHFLRKLGFTVPPDLVNPSIMPFWANDKAPRNGTKDLGGIRIHIINVVLTIKYRDLKLPTTIDTVLFKLQNDQAQLEREINALTTYVNSAAFNLLSQSEKDLLTAQLAAMNTYNDCLKTRILNY